jgi:hypothetical protein
VLGMNVVSKVEHGTESEERAQGREEGRSKETWTNKRVAQRPSGAQARKHISSP